MITFTLVAILGVLLVIVLMNLFKKDPKPLPTPVRPVEDLANLKVTDDRPGDVLSVAGAGDRMTDLDYTVDRGTRCDAGSRTWVELSGPYLERRVKMMAIGLGKFAGAQRYHSYAYKLGLEYVIRSVGRQVLKSGKILGGLAILEDAYHNTAKVDAVPVEAMRSEEHT